MRLQGNEKMRTFPKELTELNHWVCWRIEQPDSGRKPTKVPYNPHTGKKASTVNSASWGSLADAENAEELFMYSGIGFVFSEDIGIVGVDVDHCRNSETGALSDTAVSIIEKIATYTEISPSGEGLHMFFKGTMPKGGNKNTKTGVEMYCTARYFTMTGQKLDGGTDVIAEDNGILQWISDTYIKPKKQSSKPKRRKSAARSPLSDEDVIIKATTAGNADAFAALWSGNWQGEYPSQSEADMALCCKLAFWTGKNAEQTDRLFRQSGLMREKWDVKHHSNGATYGEETTAKAMEAVDETYTQHSDSPVFEYDGRYFRAKGDSIYPITNFVVAPVEMIVSEDETQMTADLVTDSGEMFRQTFMTTDFANLQRFKNIINKRTISLSYTGTEGELELLKNCISGLEWKKKAGVKAMGIYRHGGRLVFVNDEFAVEKNGTMVEDIIQLGKYRSIQSDILQAGRISVENLRKLGELLLGYNEYAKTVSILAWCTGCFLKEHLRNETIKYPHLFLIGEAGSGKSNTLERVILPLFSRSKVTAATQVTAFTLMKESASSNIIPQPLDEFKPSKIDKNKLAVLYNHMRDSYDWHEGIRGRADQSTASYILTAPLVVAGEESPDEPSIRERSIELLFSKKDLKPHERRKNFKQLSEMQNELGDFGRSLLDIALRTDFAAVKLWHTNTVAYLSSELPARVVSNIAACVCGLKILERMCLGYSVSFEEIFGLTIEACVKYLMFGAKEYLLDGNTSNKGVLEQSIEIMARMELQKDVEWIFIDDGKRIAIRFNIIYDRFTKYRRDYAIFGECLEYRQFLKQLKNSDLFVEYKTVRFRDDVHKAYVLDFTELTSRCDVEKFTENGIRPLK